MSENNSNDKPKATNTTSFASILAGVQKLRQSADKIQITRNQAPPASSSPSTTTTIPTQLNHTQKEKPLRAPPPPHNVVDSSTISYSRDNNNINNNKASQNYPEGIPKSTSFTKTSIYKSQYARDRHIKFKDVVSKIAVNPSQKGNPLLQSLKNIPYEFTSIVKTDYLINNSISVIFLSLKYHKLRPDYIYERLKKIGTSSLVDNNNNNNNNKGQKTTRNDSQLRVLLLVLDADNNYWDSLQELTRLCVFNNFTLLAAWNYEEAGEYISLLKSLDSTPTYKVQGNVTKDKFDIIKGIQKEDYYSRLLDTLTSVRSINKTDVSKVASSGKFRNFKDLVNDDGEQLELIEGFGNVKIKRFKNAINEPFLYNKDYDSDEKISEWKEKCKKIRLEREQKKLDNQEKETIEEIK
ncbi:DNA repair protein [Saccharomycopsis crataegensis]|uniref:DNA repair protein n=1 Tax=Saccharomycopsis crataegensis TaxID=43959 RepID=A0AAV5QLK9_9ASCO|nr:DNA repair protein [Saccharomycopsis crataegensis]